jgi:hypothetical protein
MNGASVANMVGGSTIVLPISNSAAYRKIWYVPWLFAIANIRHFFSGMSVMKEV